MKKFLVTLGLLLGITAHAQVKIGNLPLGAPGGVVTADAFPYENTTAGNTYRFQMSDLPLTPAFVAAFATKQNSLSFINSIVNSSGNVSLVNDSATPGNSYYYGTDGGGTKGYHLLSTGSISTVNLVDSTGVFILQQWTVAGVETLTIAGFNNGSIPNAATSATQYNNPLTIVLRDGAGNFSAGVIKATLSGSAATAGQLAVAPIVCGANTFANSTDVWGNLICTSIPNAATTATNANTPSAIVARDGSGNFSAGTITATLTGSAATAGKLGTTPNACGANTFASSIDIYGNLTCTSIPNASTTATSANTPSAIVARDGSGNFSAGTITATIVGSAATAGKLGTAPLVCGANTFANSTDVYGNLICTSIPNAATTATNANTPSAIVARDGSGNFSAGTITATLTGSAATAGKLGTTPNACGANTFASSIDVFGNLTCTSIPNAATTATSANTPSAIVARDGSGNFSAGTITATLTGSAATAGKLGTAPNVCGANTFANSIDIYGNLSCTSIPNAATTATSANTPSSIVARDGSGNFSAGTITATLTGSAATAGKLGTTPLACTGSAVATSIDIYGNLTCANVSNVSVASTTSAGTEYILFSGTQTGLNTPTTTPGITLDASTNTITAKLNGSAATAGKLGTAPTVCSGSNFSQGIDIYGNSTCATPSGGGGGTPPVTTLNDISGGATYSLLASDATGNGSTQPMIFNGNATTSTLITIPANATTSIPVGGRVDIMQSGTGSLGWTPAAGVTLNQAGTQVAARFDIASLIKTATNTWYAFGEVGGFISLSGGSPTCNVAGNYTLCSFTTTGANTITVTGGPTEIAALVIGGGGGSDGATVNQSGSAGAGGGDVFCASNGASTTCLPNIVVTPGQSISATIGTGGTGGANAGGHGSVGGNTSITLGSTFTANGGGYGSSGSRSPSTGGSGGGGDASSTTAASGTGTNVHSGGAGLGATASGGGGGANTAGAVGNNTSGGTGGNGGDGLDFQLCGVSIATTFGGSFSPAVSAGGGGDNFGGAVARGGTGGSSGAGGSGGTVGNGGLGQPGVTYGSGGGGGFANAVNSNASGAGKQGAIVICYRSS